MRLVYLLVRSLVQQVPLFPDRSRGEVSPPSKNPVTMGMTVVERHEDDLVPAPALGAPSLSNDDAVKDSDQRRVGLKAEHDAAIHFHVGLQIQQAVHIDRMQIAPGASQRTCVRNPGTTAC